MAPLNVDLKIAQEFEKMRKTDPEAEQNQDIYNALKIINTKSMLLPT